MSLDPHWFSTIFGVYYFSGALVGFVALLTVVAVLVQRAGLLRRAITVEHYHDLGKLLFAFTVFWAYIAFSQYMLYWYANSPRRPAGSCARQSHGWGWVGLTLLFGQFLLPFLALLSRTPKRRPRTLAVAAVWILLVHWVDLYWLVVPEVSPRAPCRSSWTSRSSSPSRPRRRGHGPRPAQAVPDRRARPAPGRVNGVRERLRSRR